MITAILGCLALIVLTLLVHDVIGYIKENRE